VQPAIGKSIQVLGKDLKIVGVARSSQADNPPIIVMPISLLSPSDLHRSPPSMLIEAYKTEEVPLLKSQLETWIKQEFGAQSSDFTVRSQDFWIDQASKGFLIFRIVMGLIIGLSVMVGGVGVMNVLLISVNERTAEIGLRKAVGAKKSDIRRLFLAESITVSAFGSLVGLFVGAGFAMAAIPIIRFFAEVPFTAAFTWNTFFIICGVAVLIGILFGTYPAIKAARLDPVEALRRE
jgi:putative ABC transport system permease protein